MSLGDAAHAIGVSVDTLRRWDRAGKLRTERDERNRRRVPRTEVERLSARPPRHGAGDGLSARNRFPGVVRSVEVDGRDGAGRDRGRAAPRNRGDHARLRSRSWARRRRARDRDREGDLGDDRARAPSEVGSAARACSADGHDADQAACGGGSQSGAAAAGAADALTVSAASSLSRAFSAYGAGDPPSRALLVRGLRRARRADPPGRRAGRLRGRQHRAAADALRGGAGRASRSSSPATAWCSRCRRAR